MYWYMPQWCYSLFCTRGSRIDGTSKPCLAITTHNAITSLLPGNRLLWLVQDCDTNQEWSKSALTALPIPIERPDRPWSLCCSPCALYCSCQDRKSPRHPSLFYSTFRPLCDCKPTVQRLKWSRCARIGAPPSFCFRHRSEDAIMMCLRGFACVYCKPHTTVRGSRVSFLNMHLLCLGEPQRALSQIDLAASTQKVQFVPG